MRAVVSFYDFVNSEILLIRSDDECEMIFLFLAATDITAIDGKLLHERDAILCCFFNWHKSIFSRMQELKMRPQSNSLFRTLLSPIGVFFDIYL